MGSVVIAAGGRRAEVRTEGAALVAYDVDGRPLLAPLAPDGTAAPYAGAVLAPWPNRVAGGTWSWRGRVHHLAVSEPATGSALHGLVAAVDWAVTGRALDRVRLEVDAGPAPGWPFRLRCAASYRVDGDGLTATVEAVNAGDEACPYGAGAHPYLAVPGGVDGAVLRLPAAAWLDAGGHTRPTAGTPYDLSGDGAVGGRRFDTAFTGLAAGAGARLTTPDGSTVAVWGDASVRWWQLYTCEGVGQPWERRALAVEPMTCPPNAFNSGEDLVVLEPGAGHTMTWGIRP